MGARRGWSVTGPGDAGVTENPAVSPSPRCEALMKRVLSWAEHRVECEMGQLVTVTGVDSAGG